jgi:hypothetical protein
MNPDNGALVPVMTLTIPDRLVEVRIPLTDRQKYEMKVRRYAPCPCGSGKRMKFCCGSAEMRAAKQEAARLEARRSPQRLI